MTGVQTCALPILMPMQIRITQIAKRKSGNLHYIRKRLKNIIWKTVVMSLMASPLCISCDDDDEVTVNSKFYLSTKVFPVDSYEASLSVILKDNSVGS